MKRALTTKMTLMVAIAFFIFTPLCGFFIVSAVHGTMKKSIAIQQDQSVTRIAESLDDKLGMMRDVITSVAGSVPPHLFDTPPAALEFLQSRYTLKVMFDNGLFLFDKNGKLIAELPVTPPRVGTDFSYRDYIQKTLATKKPYISDAYISSQSHHHPAIMFTAPVFSQKGELTGMLCGSFDLQKSNFVSKITEGHIGASGYYSVLNKERRIILHHDKSRMMKQDVPLGSNPLFDKAMHGFEGTAETVNSRNIKMLTTFKQLKNIPWILAANHPQQEAYSSLKSMELYFWLFIVIIGAIVSSFVWFGMQRLIVPLTSLTTQIAMGDRTQKVVVNSSDEISELANTFNRQMDYINQGEERLRIEREMFQTLSDFASDWVFWREANGVVTYSSPACENITGYSPDELLQHPDLIDEMIHPDDLQRWKNHTHAVDNGGNPVAIRFRILTKHGDIRIIDHVCRQIHDYQGKYQGTRGSNRDITESVRAEESLHEQAAILEQEIGERQVAQEELALKQKELEELNRSLEQRVLQTVEELRNKDQMMINQSRLAAMGEMINNIAHQWRQPLNTLALLLQSKSYDFEDGAPTREQMEKELEQEMDLILFMSRTIDDFRNFFKPEKEKVPFSIAESIQKAIQLVQASMNSHGIAVTTDIKADVFINGYPNEYAQTLLNILCNARDVLVERDCAKPEIIVRVTVEDGVSKVSVRDNAGGIADEILNRVFDPYFTTKEQGNGTGIGLYMSKVIIEKNMGGRLTVHNHGAGAEFIITL